MYSRVEPLFLDERARVEFNPDNGHPCITIADDSGRTVNLHLGYDALAAVNDPERALAALDLLASAVQAALVELAPSRFPQPNHSEVVDAAVFAASGCRPSEAVELARQAAVDRYSVAQAHPMSESELRTLDGNR